VSDESKRARWKIHTSFLLSEHLKIAAEGHPLSVVMKEIGDFWRGGPVRTHELLFLVLSWKSECQICLHLKPSAGLRSGTSMLAPCSRPNVPNDLHASATSWYGPSGAVGSIGAMPRS
jgi:hypothetical protein